jgi:periplasmic protein TonB
MSNAFAATRTRQHPLGLLVVAGLHVAFVLVLTDALNLRLAGPAEPPRIEARVLPDAPRPPVTPPQPVTTDWDRSSVTERFVPPDLAPNDIEAEPAIGPALEPIITAGSTTPAPPVRTAAAVDPRWPLTRAEYPSASARLGEEGSVLLELTLGRDGRVLEARVIESSGHARLDRTAVNEAVRAWRLRPATLDGTPIESRHRIRVQFRLDQR